MRCRVLSTIIGAMSSNLPQLDKILASPCLPDYAAIINERLRDEAAKRRQFYDEMSDEQKLEFIDGDVICHSPARCAHLEAKYNLATLLGTFVRQRGLGRVFDEKCLCVFPRNDYEPDIVFFSASRAVAFEPATNKFPIPELIVEVLSESTEHRDRGVKFTDFEAHGVLEYWIVDADAKTVEQYVLRDGSFHFLLKSSSGDISSQVLTGFRIPIASIFDPAENLKTLRAILAG